MPSYTRSSGSLHEVAGEGLSHATPLRRDRGGRVDVTGDGRVFVDGRQVWGGLRSYRYSCRIASRQLMPPLFTACLAVIAAFVAGAKTSAQ